MHFMMCFLRLDDGFPEVGFWFPKVGFYHEIHDNHPDLRKECSTKLWRRILKKTPGIFFGVYCNYDHLVCEKTLRVFHNSCFMMFVGELVHLAGYYFLDRFGLDNAFVKEWTEEETFCNEVTTTSLRRMLHRVLDMYPASKSFVLAHLG